MSAPTAVITAPIGLLAAINPMKAVEATVTPIINCPTLSSNFPVPVIRFFIELYRSTPEEAPAARPPASPIRFLLFIKVFPNCEKAVLSFPSQIMPSEIPFPMNNPPIAAPTASIHGSASINHCFMFSAICLVLLSTPLRKSYSGRSMFRSY